MLVLRCSRIASVFCTVFGYETMGSRNETRARILTRPYKIRRMDTRWYGSE